MEKNKILKKVSNVMNVRVWIHTGTPKVKDYQRQNFKGVKSYHEGIYGEKLNN